MPLLEQRGRARPHPARWRAHLVRFLHHQWPVAWSAALLLGLAAGAAFAWTVPGIDTPPGARWLVRVLALAPLPRLAGGGPLAAGWPLVVFCGACLVGGGYAAAEARRPHAQAPAPWDPAFASAASGAAVVRFTGWPRPDRAGGWSAPARLLAWRTVGQATAGPTRGEGALVRGEGPAPVPGSVWSGALDLEVPVPAAVPGGFDDRAFLAGRGLAWRGRWREGAELRTPPPVAGALARVRSTATRRIADLLPPAEAGIAGAVLLGARTPASREAATPFAALGLAHLFAVSGLHVGLVAGLVLAVPRLAAAGSRTSLVVLAAALLLYILVTGLPASVLRAAGMAVLGLGAHPWGRRSDGLRVLGLLLWVTAVADPRSLLDTGTLLSYLAATGIVLANRATSGFAFAGPRPWRWLLTGCAVSIAAQWATFPVAAAAFGRLSLASPLANLVAVPVFGAAMGLVALDLVLPLPEICSGAPAGLAWVLLRGLAAGAVLAERWGLAAPVALTPPGPVLVATWLGLGICAAWLLRAAEGRRAILCRVSAWVGAPALLVWLAGPVSRPLPDAGHVVVWQFDVGQGDCGLVAFPDGWSALIDAGGCWGTGDDGPLSRSIVPFLRRQGVPHLAAVVLTHGHRDHDGGAPALARSMPVERWWVGGRAARGLEGIVDSTRVRQPTTPALLHRQGEWALRLVFAGDPEAHDENDRSLAVALEHSGRAVMLWTGDLEHGGEAAMLAADSVPARCAVWKAGHHGSDTSGGPAFLARVAPRLVLVSAGVGNGYGHPSHGPWTAHGDTARVLRTDLEGSLRLAWPLDGGLPAWRHRAGEGRLVGSP